jgi:hypothetical protein
MALLKSQNEIDFSKPIWNTHLFSKNWAMNFICFQRKISIQIHFNIYFSTKALFMILWLRIFKPSMDFGKQIVKEPFEIVLKRMAILVRKETCFSQLTLGVAIIILFCRVFRNNRLLRCLSENNASKLGLFCKKYMPRQANLPPKISGFGFSSPRRCFFRSKREISNYVPWIHGTTQETFVIVQMCVCCSV